MRSLFAELVAAGYNAVFLQGGITVALGTTSIVFGEDGENFTSYVQQNLADGPSFEGDEGLSKADALQLCQKFGGSVATA
jgi:hypothetical protein